MKMKSILLTAAAIILASSPASAAVIDNTGGVLPDPSGWQPFAQPNTATYGVTFTARDNFLNSFSLFLSEGSGSLNFKGYVGTWDGTKATNILFTSGLLNKNSNDVEEFAINTGSLAVTSGQKYVAFLSSSDLGPQASAGFSMPYASGVSDPDLNFVYYNNGLNFGALTSNSWDCTSCEQAAFKAAFSATGNPGVPEPATWAMLIAGFGLVGGAMRKRTKVSVSYA